MYWIPSSIFTGVQILAMKNSHVRGVFGLKPYPKMHPPPPQRDTSSTRSEGIKEREALLKQPLPEIQAPDNASTEALLDDKSGDGGSLGGNKSGQRDLNER